MATFYRQFLRHYFGQEVSKPSSSSEKVAQATRDPQWATDLRNFRHEVLHDRAAWLAFEILPERLPKYEPILVLNWRPGPLAPEDYVPLDSLRRIRAGLREAVVGLRDELIGFVVSV